MTATTLGRGAGLVVLSLLAGLLLAGGATPGEGRYPAGLLGFPDPSESPDDPEAMALLTRAIQAEREVAYSGRQFVGSWHEGVLDAAGTFEVSATPGVGKTLRPDTGGSAARSGPLRGEHSSTTGSESAPMVLRYGEDGAEQPSGATSGDAGTAGDMTGAVGRTLGVLSRSYRIRMAGDDSSAGRAAAVVEAVRADDTLAGRFYLDVETGLLLRRDVFDGAGRLVRRNSFVELRIDDAGHPGRALMVTGESAIGGTVDGEFGGDAGSGGEQPPDGSQPIDPERAAADGWPCCAERLAGFTLHTVRTRAVGTSADRTALQLTYTDGITAASVFMQRGRLDVGGLKGFTMTDQSSGVARLRQGLMAYAVWERSGVVYTVACETSYCVDRITTGLR